MIPFAYIDFADLVTEQRYEIQRLEDEVVEALEESSAREEAALLWEALCFHKGHCPNTGHYPQACEECFRQTGDAWWVLHAADTARENEFGVEVALARETG